MITVQSALVFSPSFAMVTALSSSKFSTISPAWDRPGKREAARTAEKKNGRKGNGVDFIK
jgi:hypothetical protein